MKMLKTKKEIVDALKEAESTDFRFETFARATQRFIMEGRR